MKRWSVVFFLLVGLSVGTYFGSATSQGQQVNKSTAPAFLPRETNSYRDIVKQVLPAVVSVEAKAKPLAAKQTRQAPRAPFDDPRIPVICVASRRPRRARSQPAARLRLGVLRRSLRVLLTNAHVVTAPSRSSSRPGRPQVHQQGHQADTKTDVAIVILDASRARFPPEMGDIDAYESSDRVLAVGAPFGLTGHGHPGHISARSP